MYKIGKFNLIPFNQSRGHTHSYVDAGISLVHNIEVGWKKSLIGSALTSRGSLIT